MALDKILGKIQAQINDLAPTLELFVDESIQPSVDDCVNLQTQLASLQENLAVYKFFKQERELSPSFNIHARISKKEEDVADDDFNETKENEKVKNENSGQDVTSHNDREQKIFPPLAIGINDKFRLINELFRQNNGEYNIAVEQINSLTSWNEAELYLNSLRMIYHWKENSEVTNLLYGIVKKRFMG